MTMAQLQGSITEKEKLFLETWENVGQGTHYIIRENRRGDEAPEGVTGRRKFKLTTYERILTEDKILDPRMNPFRNGSFRPVIVPEDISLETNPNALSDEDIERLFVASKNAWDAYMEILDSPATIQRMIDLADQGDRDLPLSRYRQLEEMHARYTAVGTRLVQKDQDEFDSMGPVGASRSRVPGDTAPKVPTRTRRAGV